MGSAINRYIMALLLTAFVSVLVHRLLGVVDPGLAADDDVVALVDRLAGDLRS